VTEVSAYYHRSLPDTSYPLERPVLLFVSWTARLSLAEQHTRIQAFTAVFTALRLLKHKV
jgi:hypothetical protein